jgi:hypothetical protein
MMAANTPKHVVEVYRIWNTCDTCISFSECVEFWKATYTVLPFRDDDGRFNDIRLSKFTNVQSGNLGYNRDSNGFPYSAYTVYLMW